jgi:preprotein translocase subunit SecD
VSRRGLIALIVAYLALLGALWGYIAVEGLQPRLGLDLQGGVSADLVPAEGQGEVDEELLDQTVQVIRERVDALGVAEPDIARQGETIQVQLPGVADREQARDIIGRTAQLQFRQVVEELAPDPETSCADQQDLTVPDPDEEVVLCLRSVDPTTGEELPREQWTRLRLAPADVTGADLADARAELDPNSLGQTWYTALEFDGEGAERFEEVTGRLACLQGVQRQLAIVLDTIVEQAPPIAPEVACESGIPNGEAVVQASGEAEARSLAIVLRAGALPIQLDFGTFQTISPTLGQDSLDAALLAGLLGLLLVSAYLVVLYRGLGLLAAVEVVVGVATIVGVLIVLGDLVGFTLTLAGIAGIIVSVGIAGDSSIIYRERYRDEVRAGRTVRTAADHAFSNSLRTNFTGAVVSFLAAAVLYLLAVGPVRGFAFTLGISTIIDILLFCTFTRGMFGLVARSPRLAGSPLVGLTAGVTAAQLKHGRQQRSAAGGRRRSKGARP